MRTDTTMDDEKKLEQCKRELIELAEFGNCLAANSRCPASAGTVPLGVYRKAQHALAHGAKESQVENMINDWLRENDRPANFSFTQNVKRDNGAKRS